MELSMRQKIYSFLDITSLNQVDTVDSINGWMDTILNDVKAGFTPAALCVFSVFSSVVSSKLKGTAIKTAVVGAGFPDSQTFLSVKLAECEEAVRFGAEEVDVVLNLNAFFEGNFEKVVHEVKAIKNVIGKAKLKVILETGVLNLHQVKVATQLAIDGGANFVKTSTGRVAEGATLQKVEAISAVLNQNKGVGLKISGGVRTIDQAETFYTKVRAIMGDTFMTPDYFRIGASSLAEKLRNG